MVVEEITLGPKFPAGAFEFEPPAGARDIDEASADPYFTTSLRPGEPAPTWSGRALGTGDPVRLQDLRGKPALILLWADWCPLTDDACDVLGTYQSAYERWRSRIHFQVALVLSDGAAMKDIMTEGGYTFPVAVANDAAEAWGVEGLPMWVALDKRGVVVEARLALRSVSEIDEMVAKARD